MLSPRGHVPARFTPAPSVFPARRTIVLPLKGPEPRSDGSGATAGLVAGLCTATLVAAPALVGIQRFRHPGELGADLVAVGVAARHHAGSINVFSRISRRQFGHFAGGARR